MYAYSHPKYNCIITFLLLFSIFSGSGIANYVPVYFLVSTTAVDLLIVLLTTYGVFNFYKTVYFLFLTSANFSQSYI